MGGQAGQQVAHFLRVPLLDAPLAQVDRKGAQGMEAQQGQGALLLPGQAFGRAFAHLFVGIPS